VLTDVAGVRVGHWTNVAARTGCTVVLLPPGTVASGEVRGGAPASRELDLLAPGRLVEHVDAVLLTGGSAFGLAAADGVMTWLEGAGRGYPTPAGPVPIVVALGLYDLGVGDATVRPGPGDGRAACDAATDGPVVVGAVGAGTGATVGTWRGAEAGRPAGFGAASHRSGELVVSALVAVNAAGDITKPGEGPDLDQLDLSSAPPATPFGNTTIGVIVTNARLDKSGCLLVAQSAHDGLARAVFPAHTRADGDAFIAAAAGTVDASVDIVRILATAAVEAAIRSAASD
jgi:L-aminopeptidase/D-esterase-like protein